MPVSGVSSSISIDSAKLRTEPGKQAAQLESEAFMAMLLAQMRNQNPFEPMKENEMISQMAQMNSVQELKNLSATMKELSRSNGLLSAATMMGKVVSFRDAYGMLMESLVESVVVENDDVMLVAGDALVKLADVVAVRKGEN